MSDIHNQREIENTQAEIDRLRQILENIQQARVSQGKAIIDANNEIERLRAALGVIVDAVTIPEANIAIPVAIKEARAALEGK